MVTNQFPPAFIRGDGYFERGYLRGVKGLHPDVRFTYRPMKIQRLGWLQSAIEKVGNNQDKSYLLQAQTIIKYNHLTDWDIADSKGEVLPITVDSLMDLRPAVFVGIVAIITGREASDVDDAPEHLQDSTEQDLVALYGGDAVTPEVAAEKNSETG